jgi:hypothetical protein
MTKWVIPDTPSPEAIVKAALERAAGYCADRAARRLIEALASDPAEVAAIIKKAGEDRG